MKYVFKNSIYRLIFSFIDLLGYIVFYPAKVFNSKQIPVSLKNILVIRLDHIGDVVLSSSIAQNLKNHYKGAKVVYLVSSAGRDILSGNPYIDEFISFDAQWFKRGKRNVFELRGFWALSRKLRAMRFDLGFDPRGDFRHILLMALSGIKYKVGYGITGGGFLLDREAFYWPSAHALDHNLDLLRGLGINVVSEEPLLCEKPQDKVFVDDFLKESSIASGDFKAVVHACAGNTAKNWLPLRFAELIKRLGKEYNAKVIFIGSGEDADKISGIINASGVNAVNAVGRIPLDKLFVLLKRVDLFIGLDSGPSHIAAAANTPSVVLYSGTNKAGEWAPKAERLVVIQKYTKCQGCQRTECHNNVCMGLISVDEVMACAKRMLSR